MNHRGRFAFFMAGCALAVAYFAAADDRPIPLPPDSIYQLQARLEDQSGAESPLDRYAGHPTLVTMFYGSCPHVCPMLLSTIAMTERALAPAERGRLRVLAISIDPQRDTPELLHEVGERHRLDYARWSLTRPAAEDVRQIAGVLGIRFRRLQDGEFNHTTQIILLDPDGVPVARTGTLGRPDPAFLSALRQLLNPDS